ncbi:hypothetical protein MMC25_005697 [Agyrium rufum]|nr:hypothetical protein [Agyrium rufum]
MDVRTGVSERSNGGALFVLIWPAMFSPLAFPSGFIFYDFITSETPAQHASLVPFEVYRETLCVIGIADSLSPSRGRATDATHDSWENEAIDPKRSLPNIHETMVETVVELKVGFPSALLHQVFLFDFSDTTAEFPSTVIAVPPPNQSRPTTMRTLMCDFSSTFLGELTSYAKSIQALPNVETPRPMQVNRSSQDYYEANDISRAADSRPGAQTNGTDDTHSMFQTRPANPQSDRPRSQIINRLVGAEASSGSERRGSQGSHSRPGTPSVTFDEIQAQMSTSSPPKSEISRPSSRESVPVQGFGPSSVGERARNRTKGRVDILMGSLLLLSGRWPDAMKDLSNGGNTARLNSDHAWHAKALDHLTVCMLMLASIGMDFEIPQICYPSGEKPAPSQNKASKHTQSSSLPNLTSSNRNDNSEGTVTLRNLNQLLPDLANHILNLYVRAAAFASDQVPQLVYSTVAIRFGRLLLGAKSSSNYFDERRILGNNPWQIGQTDRETTEASNAEIFQGYLSNFDIAEIFLRALPVPGCERWLLTIDHLGILASIAAGLSELGHHRKQALLLKESMSVLMPALVQNCKESAAELGFHPAASLTSLDYSGTGTTTAAPASIQSGSDGGIHHFLSMMCDIYGVVSGQRIRASMQHQNDGGNSRGSSEVSDTVVLRAVQNAMKRAFGDQHLKADILRSCINICEALPDLQGILDFSADLLRTASSGIIPSPDSSDGSPKLSIDDQIRLSQSIGRTASAVAQMGSKGVKTQYWDEFLVRKIEITKTSLAKAPLAHEKSELVSPESTAEVHTGPFLHNAFTNQTKAATREPVMVVGEESVFSVVLQNLYDFDLEIEWIKLDTQDVSVHSFTTSSIIGPYRTQNVQISAIPQAPGQARIVGCVAKVKGCEARNFPIFPNPWKASVNPKLTDTLSTLAVQIERSENNTASIEESKALHAMLKRGPEVSTFSVKVIPKQPRIVVKNMSLAHSVIVLSEGETKSFTLTIQNISTDVDADLVLLTFSDSFTRIEPIQDEKDLTSLSRYEKELDTIHHPTLTWQQSQAKQDQLVQAGSTKDLTITARGKRGFDRGTIHVNYGYIGVPHAQVEAVFHTRQLSVSISITMLSSPRLVENEFLPFTGDFAWHNQQQQQRSRASSISTPTSTPQKSPQGGSESSRNRFQSLLSRLGLGHQATLDHCLVLLDIQNPSIRRFSISVQIRQMHSKETSSHPERQESVSSISAMAESWRRAYTVHEYLRAGGTSRLVLLLPRINVRYPYRPIPSLNSTTKRQFVVNANKDSAAEEMLVREYFWYREEILKLMRAEWVDEDTGARGELSLRSLYLNSRMLEVLRVDEVQMELSIRDAGEANSADRVSTQEVNTPSLCQKRKFSFVAKNDVALVLQVRITNRMARSTQSTLRVQPLMQNQPAGSVLDFSRRLAFNGPLQRALPILLPGETHVINIGMASLSKGDFEFHVIIEETILVSKVPSEEQDSRTRSSTVDISELGAVMPDKREQWACKEPLHLSVR